MAITFNSSPGHADKVVGSITSEGGKAVGIAADAGGAEAVRAAVNGTGGGLRPSGHPGEQRRDGPSGPIDQLTVDDFDRSVPVNIRSVFVAAQEALRQMGRRPDHLDRQRLR
ncbi:hypothetical protein [Streptomyces europaeiscabiei]|uniref:hypothetical protein n=1 Tax=Streptomyces europaeiscabiei TaxID=146819 RepID=UPI001F09AEDF|nr:hypothetical protein [Streptomyces europaeiscabiei]MDX3833260.1 hypothetical protein [Streptomyces europaeiscabiei]MDX3847263.1 hypothetical protein [Streptomyces europaeiscabiei]